ncbi:DUF4435 domain-containing protein [Acinetobacter terrestris]|uniref:DUF4435 domain-containing protein n=1 Tax=Acinetobacter terrestris TaxID=2529843 RepID=UPI00103F1DA5|nr:DUF4435 domain-containing protein [Acinetobacter terrestris]TCB55298.1 DUF4435 domain-containing protein [Acinetobacter terrestris]
MSKNKQEEDKVDVEGLIAHIKDGELFNIIIEGKDDKLVYDEFEEIYGLTEPLVSVLEVGGRNNVLEIFKALKDTPHINKAVFIVDQDQWVLTGIDPQYDHPNIIHTHGYSFENDVFLDGNLEAELIKRCNSEHISSLSTLLQWYTLEVDRIRTGHATQRLDMSPEHLFNPLCTHDLITPKEGETFNHTILEELKTTYPKLLRGKTLLKYYVYLLNKREGLNGAHSTRATIDNVASNKGNYLNRIFSDVDQLYKSLTT